jgi:hypothetical protein
MTRAFVGARKGSTDEGTSEMALGGYFRETYGTIPTVQRCPADALRCAFRQVVGMGDETEWNRADQGNESPLSSHRHRPLVIHL